jgi:hypothetical protein
VVDALVDGGNLRIRVLPMFLGVGRHAREDLPALVADLLRRHPGLHLELLRPVGEVGTGGDFVIYSPHKHLPVPDGSVLVVRPKGPGGLGQAAITSFGPPATWADQLRHLPQQIGATVKSSEIHAWLWLVKRVVQKLGFRRLGVAGTPFIETTSSESAVAPTLVAPPLSSLAGRLLGCVIGDLGQVARQRQRHQLLWDAISVNDGVPESGSPEIAERSECRAWTPYYGAYRLASVSSAETAYRAWQSRGLPVMTWPDLPPEVMLDRERHANAWELRHTRLYLPVHQSLAVREMVRRGCLSRVIPKSGSALELDWGDVSADQWGEWMTQAGRSNLLQSWAYGDAKAESSGLRVKRAAVYRGGEPVAFVQVLQKTIAKVLHVSRINRGPVFLKSPAFSEVAAVWRELAGLGNIFRFLGFNVNCYAIKIMPGFGY